MNEGIIFIGIDVGSTTVKLAVLDENLSIIFSKYDRHHTKQASCVLEILLQLENQFPQIKNGQCKFFMTGSGASTLAPKIGARFVQEVNAVAFAVEKLHPKAKSVFELGGQDAKVIFFKENENHEKRTLTYMNDKCASGTGATIDKCMLKVGMEPEKLINIKFNPEKLHHVAAKCGVFAETDIVNLIKSGIPKEDIMNSLADAIVNQNLSVLTRGNTPKDEIILLGGPNTYLPFLVDCWRYRIKKTWEERGFKELLQGNIEDKIFVPENSLYYAALGSCYFGMNSYSSEKYRGVSELKNFISGGRKEELLAIAGDPLIRTEEELKTFKDQYSVPPFKPKSFKPGEEVVAYLGLDGGSTSTKCALIDQEGNLILKVYTLSRGNPFEDFKVLIEKIKNHFNEQEVTLIINGFGVTGYAAAIFEKVFLADVNVIETVAHMKSSQKVFGNADVICDIGGQDIKVLFLKAEELSNFKLSNQCSAGNGMILQGMAEQFGHAAHEYADLAFKAELAPNFSYGCGVFLDSDRVNFQKQGFSKEEIMAGLAQVLPKNIWQYVVQVPRLESFGKRFVLQGGTQYNQAALKAQVDYIKKRVKDAEVFVHPHPGEAGAIGAALEAKEIVELRGYTTFIGIEDAYHLKYSTKSDESTRCHFCPNHCTRTFVDTLTPNGKSARYISGFSCEKGTVEDKEALKKLMQTNALKKKNNPNLVRFQAKEIFTKDISIAKYHPDFFEKILGNNRDRSTLKIAMPRVLNMWIMAPFFNAYFLSIGIKKENIIWSSETNEQMSKEGMKYGSIDPCFPAKVAQAHIHQLIYNEKMEIIYFPAITHTPNFLERVVDSTSCPVVQGTPLVIRSSFTTEKDYFKEHNISFINDAIDFQNKGYLKKQLFKTWGQILGLTKGENNFAVDEGFKALDQFELKMEKMGQEIIENAESQKTIAVLLIGRPYHLDPGLNHQILDEIQNLGFPILTMTSIPKNKKWLSKYFESNSLDINDVWPENFSTNSAQKVWAAKFAARNPHIAVIDISSFKCGHDAPTYGIIDSITGTAKSSYLALHDLDQTSPTESFKIRLKTFAYNLNKRIERMNKDSTECKVNLSTGLIKTQEISQKVKDQVLPF
jgi:activator of 2-hydroxyglutaryl-CoA dehydratase/predicted nucleotide-binding protein (sugar kinase/HSP70/actin superfamily)